ncbi:MAG: hypothetical protein H6816_02410 [Phycisphaerales bacterium]|nr:hypothetical protein [Phycisphaerales bacterium]
MGLIPTAASAHSVSVCRGEMQIADRTIHVEVTIPALDVVTCIGPRTTSPPQRAWDVLDACALTYADHIVDELIIRDETGARLPGTFVSVTHDFSDRETDDLYAIAPAQVTFALDYRLEHPPTYLTLQQLFFTHGAMHAARLVLAARAGDAVATVQLTNRGEPVTIHLERTGDAVTIDQPAAFRILHADVAIDTSGARVEIAMPFTLLETWTTIDRAAPDFLNRAEQHAARSAARELLTTRNPVRINGAEIAPHLASVQLLDPTGASADRLYTGAARVVARLEYPSPAPPRDLTLHWTLFNSAVVVAEVTLHANATERRFELSTYTPDLHWPPTPPAVRPGSKTQPPSNPSTPKPKP